MSGPARCSPGTRDAVERLMRQLPPDGISAVALSKIGRLPMPVVQEALVRLEAAGIATRGAILKDGKMIELWRRV